MQPETVSAVPPVVPDVVRGHLARVLASPAFKATERRRDMLQFLVEEMLAGRGQRLKGYSIGVAVFGRGEEFDPQADPVVRLEARRLRRDLDSYYATMGRNDPIRISIPLGHYNPVVTWTDTEDGVPVPVAPTADEANDDDLASGSADAPTGSGLAASLVRHRVHWLAWAGLAVLAGFAALGLYLFDAATRKSEFANAVRSPAIMVLPFRVQDSNSKEGELIGYGIAEQISRDLVRFGDFRIYLPSSEFGRELQQSELSKVQALAVTYVVQGAVEIDDRAVRLNASLIETQSGQIVWAQEYVRSFDASSLMRAQRDIASAVASTLGQPYGVVKSQITRGLTEQFPLRMTSYECVLRAVRYRQNFNNAERAPLIGCLKTSVEQDPHYADAWAMLGWLYLDEGRFAALPDGERTALYNEAIDAASRGVALDGSNILALKALSSIYHYMGNYQLSEEIQRRALALNPIDPDTLAQLGWRLAVRGRFHEGIPLLKQAINRSVDPPSWYYHLIAIDDYLNGDYQAMLAAAKPGTVQGSGISWSFLAIAYGALGDTASARDALQQMAALSPDLENDPGAVYRRHGAIDKIADALVEGLRQAGWKPSNGKQSQVLRPASLTGTTSGSPQP